MPANDPTAAPPDPDDHVARLRAEIDAVKVRRASYRSKAAETVARGGPVHATDEELGIIKTDDTIGKEPLVVCWVGMTPPFRGTEDSLGIAPGKAHGIRSSKQSQGDRYPS
jgi:hypothetical protein